MSSERAEDARRRRAEDLERRIAELESLDESAFGHFGVWDWLACVLAGLGLPIAALWWFAR